MENSQKEILLKVTKVLFVILIWVLFAAYHGVLPIFTIPSLGINYVLAGEVGGKSFLVANNILYPFGGAIFEGYGIIFIGQFLCLFIKNSEIALSCTYFFLYTVSFLSLMNIGSRLTKSYLLTLLMLCVFFLNPFLLAQSGIPYVYFGVMLMPVSLLLDIKFLQFLNRTEKNKKNKVLLFLLMLIGRLFFTSIGWYMAVITAVLSNMPLLIYSVYNGIKEKKWAYIIRYAFYNLLPWFIAMAFITLITPRTAASTTFSLEWVNAGSVDIATFLLPSNNLLVSRVIPSVSSFLGEGNNLFGDATMWNNYIGYTLLGVAIAYCFKKKLNNDEKVMRIAMIITAIVALLLSIGPGIRFMETFEGSALNYKMSLEDNLIIFPWKFIFEVFPLKSMRSAYRWIAVFDIIALLFAFKGLVSISQKGKYLNLLAVVLGLFMVFEFFPVNGLLNQITQKREYVKQQSQFYDDVVVQMDNYLEAGDVIAFCNYNKSDNSYMLPYMMEKLECTTYSGAGDKSILLAEEYLPDTINQLESCVDIQQMTYYIVQAFERGMCDAIIFPYFDMNQDSYLWNDTVVCEETRMLVEDVTEGLQEHYQIDYDRYFAVVRPYSESDYNARYELIKNDKSNYNSVDFSSLFNTYKNVKVENGQVFNKSLILEEAYEQIYVSLYVRGEAEEKIVIEIEEISGDDEVLNYQSWECMIGEEYLLFENVFDICSDTRKIDLRIFAESEYRIKNVVIDPIYNSYSEVLPVMRFDGTNVMEIDDPYVADIGEMQIQFSAKISDSEDATLLSKMNGWCDNMSYAFLVKRDHIILALSDDGSVNYNFYIEKELLDIEKWNQYKIVFNRGKVAVYVNGKCYINENVEIEKIYGSVEDVKLGSAIKGEVADLSIQYN